MIPFLGLISLVLYAPLADSLYNEGDYYRAITEYKRALYTKGLDSTTTYSKISQCYEKSGRYDEALDYYSRAQERSRTVALSPRVQAEVGWLLLMADRPEEAQFALEGTSDTLGKTLLGLAHVLQGRVVVGQHMLSQTGAKTNPSFADEHKFAVFSKFIPGSGQLLLGQPLEGVTSLGAAAGTGTLCYRAIRRKSYGEAFFWGTLFLRFYRGAEARTRHLAKQRNRKAVEQDMKEMRSFSPVEEPKDSSAGR